MTEEEINATFSGFENAKGLPETKLEFFIKDFRDYIEKLNSYDDVLITHLYLKECEPSIMNDFERFESYFEIQIPIELKSLYNQSEQIQLRWINKKHPRFDSKEDNKFSPNPFSDDIIEDDMGKARYLNLTAFDFFLQKVPGVYLDFKKNEGLELYYLNYNHHFSGQLSMNINSELKKLEFYSGDDHYAEAWKVEIDFGDYMQNQIKISDDIVNNASKE